MCIVVKVFDIVILCCEMFGIIRFIGLIESFFINIGCCGFEVINNI